MDDRDCCPTTAGGNSTITNGSEQEPLDSIVEIPTRTEAAGLDAEFH